jgi:hypothetical protein
MAGVTDWGTATVGRLVLREGFTLTAGMSGTSGFRTLTLTGEESSPPLTVAETKRRQEDILGLQGKLVPITFTNKDDHNGWYTVDSVDTQLTNWTGEVVKFSWTIQATRVGAEQAVDLESRAASVIRANSFSLGGERWHAPAGGAVGYYTGSATPSSSVSRPVADGGTLTVYRGLPAATSPRWGCTLAGYQTGRARVLVNGVERVADDVAISASASWELQNGVIRVRPGSGNSLDLAIWDGSVWDSSSWNASVSASAVTTWDAASIVRNDYELVTLRLLKNRAPGRAMLDLSVRRGAPFVEAVWQTDTAATVGFGKKTTEAMTSASAGVIRSTSADAGGNYSVMGSPKTFQTDLVNGAISASGGTRLDAFLGYSLNGASAAAGDTVTVLRDQYILILAETTMGGPR